MVLTVKVCSVLLQNLNMTYSIAGVEKLEAINKLMTEFMTSLEAKCRYLCTGLYGFSSVIKYYIKRCWVMKRFMWFKWWRKKNKANIKQAMQWTYNINQNFGIPLWELYHMLGDAKEDAKQHMLESPALLLRS